MTEKQKMWNVSNQFDDNLYVTNLAKYQHGMSLRDFAFLTELSTFEQIFENYDKINITVVENNAKLDYVSPVDRYTLGIHRTSQDFMDCDLYLRKVSFNEFYVGFFEAYKFKETNIGTDSLENLEIEFSNFFNNIASTATFTINHDDALNMINGYESFFGYDFIIEDVAERYEEMNSVAKIVEETILKKLKS